MIDPEFFDSGLKWSTGAALMIAVVNGIWRLASTNRRDTVRDNADSKRVRAEGEFIESLQREIALLRQENKELRERADLAFSERNAALNAAEKLRGELQMLHRDVSDLQLQMELLKGDMSMMEIKRPSKEGDD